MSDPILFEKHFDIEKLKKLVSSAGAPPIGDTFNAQAVARQVNMLIHNSQIPERAANPKYEKTRRALADLESCLPIRIANARRGLEELSDHYQHTEEFLKSPVCREHQATLEKFERLLSAVKETRALSGYKTRSRGQHGGNIDHSAAADLRQRLLWAWEEAGQPVGPAKQVNFIVSECLRLAGQTAAPDTIRRQKRAARESGTEIARTKSD